MRQDKTPSGDVLFVAVDEPSVNIYGRWPWNREIIAQGLDQLSKADVVLMDMIFSEPTLEEQDEALGEALDGLNNSVCGFFLRKKSTQNISEEQEDVLVDSALDRLLVQIRANNNKPNFVSAPYTEMNIETILDGCSMSGAFSTIRDEDQLLRGYPTAYFIAEENGDLDEHDSELIYPSLGVQALRLRTNSDILRVDDTHLSLANRVLELNEKGFVRLNYYKKELYQSISFSDLISKRYSKDFFENKIVILGITDIGAGDIRATPLGEIPGPLLHYTFISNVLENHLINDSYKITAFALSFLILLPLLLIFIVNRTGLRVVIYISTYVALFFFARWMFVENYIYIDVFYPLIAIFLSGAILEIIEFTLQEQKSRFVKGAFSNYLSGDLLDQLIENPEGLNLGGENKELTVLFSDIRSFTSISESMSPEALITLLNRYFTPMTNSVLNHGGMLDKYIGDALMAFFNAPVDVKNHPSAACDSALEMIEELDKLNEVLKKEGIAAIEIGIGINTAEVVVGNMGSDTRFNYTVIGDGVNLASRVEGLTKNYGVKILITEFTLPLLEDRFLTREIESVMVKGKNEAVSLFELMKVSIKNQVIKEEHDVALEFYKAGDHASALEAFKKLLTESNDRVATYYIDLLENDTPWGIHKMTTK